MIDYRWGKGNLERRFWDLKERYGSLDGLDVSVLMEWIFRYFLTLLMFFA